jgi:serine/threonine-protein kinase
MEPASGPAAAPDLAHSPTLTGAHGTQLGVILGTAAYMAPEQARGGSADKRADVWAFGVLLHEMLTGRRLFEGETVSDTLAAVLRADIDLAALPAGVPPAIRTLLRRCLERNPRNRLHDVADARIVLEDVVAGRADEVAPAAAPTPRRSTPARALPWAVAALLAAALAWALWPRLSGGAPLAGARSPVLAIHLPPGLTMQLDEQGLLGQVAIFAISPDGSRIVFVEGGSAGRLVLREIESAELRPMEGTEGASSPFFSPDGRWLAYFAPGKLRKVPVDGGRSTDLAVASLDRGGVWCPDGSIVFAPDATSPLSRLRAGADRAEPLTRLEEGERTHRWPALLPGGREVAFTVGVVGQPGDYEDSRIDAVDLSTGERRELFRGASMVRFTPGGVALLGRDKEIVAMPLAGAAGRSTEDARPVLRDVAGIAASGVVFFDVAADGTMVYAERDPHADQLELVWYGPSGEAEPLGLPTGPYRTLRISPDGTRVAIAAGPGGGRGGDVWVLDLASRAHTKLTFDDRSISPIWSRDGLSVTYQVTLPDGGEEFHRRPADGSAPAAVVARFATERARAPVAWMHDGSLLYWEDAGAGSGGDLVYLPPGGGEPRAFAVSPVIENQASVSPDGRYVAFVGYGTGRGELYVQPFPPTGAKWLVDEDGTVPLWSVDGRELLYTRDRELFAVPISATGAFAAGAPRELFEFPEAVVFTDDTTTAGDVARDGRILVPRSTSTRRMGDHLVVVLNWFETLKEIR